MATDADQEETDEETAKKSKLPLILGVVLALVGGGGGFFAASSGMILAPAPEEAKEETETKDQSSPNIAFVELEPVMINLRTDNESKVLRFRAQLEVPTDMVENIELLKPRVIDVFNSYLRALSIENFEDPLALVKIRSHLTRRAKIVTGEEMINDLLVMEFVIN